MVQRVLHWRVGVYRWLPWRTWPNRQTNASVLSPGERLATLLVTRAAATFFLDSGAQDLLQDLHRAFRESPSGARRQFEAVLSAGDRERLHAQVQEAADLGFSHFQETVRSRPELREDSGRELLVPVTRALRVLCRVAPPGARPGSLQAA